MDNQQGSVESYPHWIGHGTSYELRASDSDGSFSIPARVLNITWGNDPRYWRWIKLSEEDAKLTGFEGAAMLDQVNWLEIIGKFNARVPMTLPRSYQVYYILKFNEDAFGWNHASVVFKVKLHNDEDEKNQENIEMKINLQRFRDKPDVWHQVLVGEFWVRDKRETLKVEVGMFEVESEWWKGNMILGGIKIKPNY